MKFHTENMIHTLFPRRCPFCDQVIFSSIFAEASLMCPECEKSLEYVTEPVCKKCGKPIESEQAEYCYDCGNHTRDYVQGKSVWIYKKQVKSSLYRFKYQNRREYAVCYGAEMVRLYRDWMQKCQIEAVVPIPLYKTRKRRRGYNQAELLAAEISRRTGIPVCPKLLTRIRNTKAQKTLNDLERKNNLKKAFKCSENKVQLKHILLVDDIYTTGSTINEAASVLKKAGAERVYYISVSIGRGY